jgi:hypothetical protein
LTVFTRVFSTSDTDRLGERIPSASGNPFQT